MKVIIRCFSLCGVLLVVASCNTQQSTKRTDIPIDSPKVSTIETALALTDIAISFDPAPKEFATLPQSIGVRFANKSAKRGYFELPGPVRGQGELAYRAPALAVAMQCVETPDDHRGGIFLYAPAEHAARSSVALLDPKASVVVQYPLQDFCMIGHGIEPDPEANVLTCYKPGMLKTEMRLNLITDWNGPTGVERTISDPILVNLSEPDLMKHRDFRRAIEPAREGDEVETP